MGDTIAFSLIAVLYAGIILAAVLVWRNERELKRHGYKGQ
jgi:hypothetical protein